MPVPHDAQSPVGPGDILAGKYRVEKVLGVGGMGVVVAAEHVQLSQKVALKFVLPGALQSEAAVERFLREARAAVRLKSEHVAKVQDVGTLDNGAPYMVMEYLEGSDLAAVIQDVGQLPIVDACDYVVQACEAVAEAHSLGIIHRDLKPQNLFLTQAVGGAPLVKVLDFGVSKIDAGPDSRQLTQTSTVMGSPLYMAPEQMRSARNADARSDIWALGVVLYELLTGAVPFDAESMPELCLKVVSDPMPSMRELRADVPEALEAIVRTCLEKNPDNRYSDPAELSAALAPFAPETSRETIERTRLVTTRMSTTGGSPRRSSVATAKATSQPELRQTPVPWAGTQSEAKKSDKSKMPFVAIAVVGVVALAAVLAITMNRGAPASAPTAAAPPPPATQAAPQPTTPPAVATIAPAVTLAPTVAAIPSADAAPSAALPTTAPAKLAPIRPTATPPKRRDDEIPSIR
jgi:serine/threonine protein kinase